MFSTASAESRLELALTLYELVGTDDRRFSPYCWRTRMALAHKGLTAEFVPCKFTDKDKIAFSGQERVPVLQDGETTISDSWNIACYLDDHYADRPPLMGGDIGRGEAMLINAWVDNVVHVALIGLVVKDIFDHTLPEDRDYFRTSREARFGTTLEEMQAPRDEKRADFRRALSPARAVLRAQDYICGDTPAYADYILFGAFQWSRGISEFKIIDEDDPVHAWRGRMMERFDGLANTTTAYPV